MSVYQTLPPAASEQEQLDSAAACLVRVLRRQWRAETERLQVHHPYSLPVRWLPASPRLTDDIRNISDTKRGKGAVKPKLDEPGDDIVAAYRRVPSRRMVVLGAEGSGKSVLVMRLLLGLLELDDSDAAKSPRIPMIFAMRSWNPRTTPLRDWLVGEMVSQHDALYNEIESHRRTTRRLIALIGASGKAPREASLAARLVDAGKILPILDGFEEMAPALRPHAIQRLNNAMPLVLVSKTGEYGEVVKKTGPLSAAAAIELQKLSVGELVNYLPRTENAAAAPQRSAARWLRVLGPVDAHDVSQDVSAVREALSSPLMVGLAREIYRTEDPAELLTVGHDGDSGSVRRHLLSAYVAKIYGYELTEAQEGLRRSRRRWHADDEDDLEHIRRWLGSLATHLESGGTANAQRSGFVWWELRDSVPRWTRTLAFGLIYAVASMLTLWLFQRLFPPPRLVDAVLSAIVLPILTGLFGGWFAGAQAGPGPVQTRFKARGQVWSSIKTFAIAFVIIKPLLLPIKVMLMIRGEYAAAWVFGTLPSWAMAFAVASTFALLRFVEAPAAPDSLPGPWTSLKATKRSLLLRSAIVIVTSGIAFGLLFGYFAGPVAGLVAAMLTLPGRLAYVMVSTAWGQWTVAARPYFALTGRLPWRTLDFIDDAHCRGVLRRIGAAYQFRHEQLRRSLLQQPDAVQDHQVGRAAETV